METTIFNNRKALLVTMHGKELAIAPFLKKELISFKIKLLMLNHLKLVIKSKT